MALPTLCRKNRAQSLFRLSRTSLHAPDTSTGQREVQDGCTQRGVTGRVYTGVCISRVLHPLYTSCSRPVPLLLLPCTSPAPALYLSCSRTEEQLPH